MKGVKVAKPILQVLGHSQETDPMPHFQLCVSDGVSINSDVMLVSALDHSILVDQLASLSVCEINEYDLCTINSSSSAQSKRMIIFEISVKFPGSVVGTLIGAPTEQGVGQENRDDAPPPPAPLPEPLPLENPENFGPPPPQQRQQQQQSQLNISHSAGSRTNTIPIAALKPYQNRWVIRARVTNKSGIRTWGDNRGEASAFSIHLLDETGEIRCTAFRNQCVKFYNVIKFGKIYYVSNCQLKSANKKFSNLDNAYEMTMGSDTEIVPCYDESTEIPKIQYDFSPISEIDGKEQNAMIDVLGVCKSCDDVTVCLSRTTQKEFKKRDVHLVDESNTMVTLTLWGTQAEEFNGESNPVVAVQGARITEFNGGKTLSTLDFSNFQVDPDLPKAHWLRGWYARTGCRETVHVISQGLSGGSDGSNAPRLTFKEAKEQQLGCKGRADYYFVEASISLIRPEESLYKSCPSDNCKKKVVQANEMYSCEKCNRYYPNFKYRLLASIYLTDRKDNQCVTAFNDEVEKMIGLTAQELGQLRESDQDAFNDKFADAAAETFLFKLRVEMENYMNENRLKTTVVSVAPLDSMAPTANMI